MARLKRESILSHIVNPDDQLAMAKVLDKVEETLQSHQTTVTNFLDPYHVQMARSILAGIRDISFIATGGFPQAERQRLVFAMDYCQPLETEAELVLLRVTGNFKFVQVTHRDYLGALLGIGLKRDKLGDLLVVPDGCYVACDGDAASIVRTQLTQVHKVKVRVEEITSDQVDYVQEPPRVMQTTLSSLRLDAVVAAGYNLSRSEATELIASEKVKVNWLVANKVAHTVEEGDLISVRGKGRLTVVEVRGLTKKGRLGITIHKSK